MRIWEFEEFLKSSHPQLQKWSGAKGGTRTPIAFRLPDPKSGASASSATFAQTVQTITWHGVMRTLADKRVLVTGGAGFLGGQAKVPRRASFLQVEDCVDALVRPRSVTTGATR